jgi:hypothetical protein
MVRHRLKNGAATVEGAESMELGSCLITTLALLVVVWL